VGREISISVVAGDVTTFDTDVLILKYAQNLYGADLVVYKILTSTHIAVPLPFESGFTFRNTRGAISAENVLFIGVEPLGRFGYEEIRGFARSALVRLASEAPTVQRLALTIHGPGYGLDEIEAFESELAGIVDAIMSGEFPSALKTVSFVERSANRAGRLSASLKKVLPNGYLTVDGHASLTALEPGARNTLRTAGYSSAAKPHIFVAMPFAETMDDVFHYGIQNAVNTAGFLCERADLSTFTGDVMHWVKQRISSSKLVVADLSSANPNVYLEVGYAWGCQIPTVLLARDTADLKFDVKGQRCILYKSIKHLEDLLSHELIGLSAHSPHLD
jgi:hypothetical protein